MLQARRAFLDRGYYRPLAVALEEVVAPAGLDVLDAGCGEGYYTRDWPARFGARVWGVDIAKDAVRYAARRGQGARYAVASVFDLPLLDASVDRALCVFAPIHPPEYDRVLRPGGFLVTVTPGPVHLLGLKRLLFAEPELHDERGPLTGAATAFVERAQRRVTYPLLVREAADVANLVAMTPFAWYLDPPARERVAALPGVECEADFVVTVYGRDGG
jgi:23S rRNA (guanine745-N1)-methyltransferase